MADKSDLERGLESFGKVLTGVTGRLLGPKAIGREELPPDVTISPQADEALQRAGNDLAKLLAAAGEGLKAHPLAPEEAVRTARAHADDPIEGKDGWSPLTTGIVTFGDGLAKVAEGVLDKVAPRKPKPDAAEPDAAPDDPPEGPDAA